jgi:isoleucyl-tRNA synthetase
MATIDENEKKILEFWKKDKTFEKSLKKTKNGKPYIFYDGPPFATGMPHYGHILGSVTKDLFGRFWTMNGRYVRRIWGWDCHGLPVETIAEKGLNINSKDEIEKIGIKKFNDFCRSKVLGYVDAWKAVIERIGRWVDMDNSYKTMDNEYIESVWWAFKQLYEKGYIYEGEKILMFCPRCSTPLAKAEVAMDNSYKNVKDETIVVKFKIKGENSYILAWTTTPWTLPSNLALAVNPKLKYAFVKDNTDGNTYVLAKDLLSKYYKSEKDYNLLEEKEGKEIEGLEYEPLFPYFSGTKNAFKVILGDFVTEEDGTGIVHIAPAFGEDDYNICRKYKIPLVQPVDDKGLFTSEVKDFAGKYVHDSNTDIIIFLKKQGKIISVRKVEHEYPFCYRCDTKLIYRAIPAWFVNIEKIKPRLLELNKKLNWYPEFLKEGRVKYTIETAPDWNISRNRYWATAMPIWISKDKEKLVIGSIEELKKYAKNLPKGKIDLHKDFLDPIILIKDGKEYKRIPEVLDCWFESGSMTFAQFHYPFENKDFFEKNFPAQFVAEYIGQVRAWFYYMLVLSAILFDDIPFEHIVTTGTILAEDGQKMSKSKNNFTDPLILIEKYGVDTLRFYLMSTTVMNAENFNFSDKSVDEIYKKLMVLLYNVNNFYGLYKDIPNSKKDSKNILDKWILSRVENLNLKVDEYLKKYNTIKACEEIRIFVDDLSTWYVRCSRERFNDNDSSAKTTLKYVLEKLSKIISPVLPFIAEIIFHNVVNEGDSVHLQDWPSYDKKLINGEVEKEMAQAREVVSLALKERDLSRISLKQPLGLLEVYGFDLEKDYTDLISAEVNVKKIELNKGKNPYVKLDINITPELEAEGLGREVSRKIQALRKTSGLVKEDKIELFIVTDDLTKKILESQQKVISDRTNSPKIEISLVKPAKNFQTESSDKFKDREILICFNKL